jgi:hypothetical protein
MSNITIVPLFGVVGDKTTFLALPYVLLFFTIIMIVSNELVIIRTKDKTKLLTKLNKK